THASAAPGCGLSVCARRDVALALVARLANEAVSPRVERETVGCPARTPTTTAAAAAGCCVVSRRFPRRDSCVAPACRRVPPGASGIARCCLIHDGNGI